MVSHQLVDMMLSLKSLTLNSMLVVTNAVDKVAWVEPILASWLPAPVKLRLRVQRLIQLMTATHFVLNQ